MRAFLIAALVHGNIYKGVSISYMKLFAVGRHGKMGAPQEFLCDEKYMLLCATF